MNNISLLITVDLERPVAMMRGFTLAKVTKITVEIAFVIDYDISKVFKFNKEKITEYYSMMMCAVGHIFLTLIDPLISFKVVGIYMIAVSIVRKSFIFNSMSKIKIKSQI